MEISNTFNGFLTKKQPQRDVVPMRVSQKEQEERDRKATELRKSEGISMSFMKDIERDLDKRGKEAVDGTVRRILKSEWELNSGLSWKDRDKLTDAHLASVTKSKEKTQETTVSASPNLFLGARLKEMLFGKETIASTEP